MKKIFSVLCSLIVLACVLNFYVSAESDVAAAPIRDMKAASVVEQEFYDNAGPRYDFLDRYVDMDQFRSYILAEIAKCEKELDFSQFNLPFSDANVELLARYIWKDLPEAFHVDSTIDPYYMPDTMKISKFVVNYLYTPTEYQTMLSACETAANEMLVGLKGNENLTDVEKALILHDRLALHCTYDLKAENRYDMYGALVNGIAVCEGYTKAYSYMLDQLNIKNYFCDSNALVHAWNILYIDGVPYHVDVTWDDPDLMGRVYHNNFLRSTAGMIATGHVKNGYIDYDSTPNSSKYDSYFWLNSTTAFQLVEDEIYFVDNENENLCKMEGEGRNRALCSASDDWFVDEQYIWTENYSVLTSACNSLLFSKADGIYAYHLSDGSVNRVYANPKINEYFSVFAFSYEEGTLSCEIRNTPEPYAFGNGATTLRASYSPAGKDHVYDSDSDVICNLCGNLKTGVAYLKGDLDGDLTVNSADAIYLLYHTLFGSARYPVDQPVDYDKNGTVNSADAIYLLYHTLFGAARYPIE